MTDSSLARLQLPRRAMALVLSRRALDEAAG